MRSSNLKNLDFASALLAICSIFNPEYCILSIIYARPYPRKNLMSQHKYETNLTDVPNLPPELITEIFRILLQASEGKFLTVATVSRAWLVITIKLFKTELFPSTEKTSISWPNRCDEGDREKGNDPFSGAYPALVSSEKLAILITSCTASPGIGVCVTITVRPSIFLTDATVTSLPYVPRNSSVDGLLFMRMEWPLKAIAMRDPGGMVVRVIWFPLV